MFENHIASLILLAAWNAGSTQASQADSTELNSNISSSSSNGKDPTNSIRSSPLSFASDDGKIVVQLTTLNPQSGVVVGSTIMNLYPGKYATLWDAIPNPTKRELPLVPPDGTCVWDMNAGGKIQFKKVMPPLQPSSRFWNFLWCCFPCWGKGTSLESEE